eukprot:jgi/Hompol1/5785/HPOL_004691-RA
MFSNDYFDITTLSGNTLRITCRGCGIGPKVTLNPDVVNFHDTPAGTTITRALYLQNNTSTHAFYQFLTEVDGTFRIDKPWGTINPNSSVALTVKFSPMEPINYYRRVYCLVEHQDAIFVDFMGTCFNDKRRPATFKPQHIFNYQERVKNGLWQYGPEHLEEMLKTGVIVCEKGILSFSDEDMSKQHSTRAILDSPYDDGLVGSEYFYENTGETLATTLVDTYVDFGACSRYRIIDPQVIRIANNTKGKMSCVWILPGETTGEDAIFTVTPKFGDILAKSVMEFKVNFRPNVDNSFYGAQLECFVYFKSMRNFRLVNEDTFTPPWCLTPTVAGNTFPPGEDTFIPKISFGATRLDFPACHVDKSVYRTVRVSNAGDTSVKFSFLDSGIRSNMGIGGGTELASKGGAIFSVKPRIGILNKGESRLIVFRFSPSEQRDYEQALKCYFNSSLNNSYVGDLQVRGVGHYPEITFDGTNALCFKPTCIGAVAVRHFSIRNISRISVNFEWHIPRQYASVVSIEPLCDTLPPNSISTLTCTFAPNTTSNYLLRLPCFYSHELLDETASIARRRASFAVIGRGMLGNVIAKPSVVDFDTILVNTIVEREIVLFNPSECDVFYNLKIYRKTPEVDDQGQDQADRVLLENNLKESELEIIQAVKALPARSNQTLKVKACVRDQTRYEFSVYYSIDANAVVEAEGIAVPRSLRSSEEVPCYHLCDVVAKGVHPVVKATDIRFSKTILWQMFSLERFNEILAEVKADPFAYADQTIDDDTFPTDSQPMQYSTSDEIMFDFGATSIGCKPTLLNLTLCNCGVVPVDWVFHFPNDLEVEIEHWADPGDYTEEQLHHNLILDNNIFCVTPKSGSLLPGESTSVLMSYSHEFAGLHKLPVVFKLRNGASRSGKEILMLFTGYSVPPTKKYLHIQSAVHQLQPISIGVVYPPIQTYRLMNRSTVSLEYYVDTSSLERLKAQNHNFDILKCPRSSGIIQPGGIDYIEWIFHPLEEKEYEQQLSDTQKLDPKVYKDCIPVTQRTDMPDQIAMLSLETINFGHLPLNTIARQVVAIRNISETVEISFKWIVPSFWPAGSIKIVPASGRLAPGHSRICKVVFSPKDCARIYDMDLVCEILNETEMEAHMAQREVYEKARREGRHMSIPEVSSAKERTAQNKDRRMTTVPNTGLDMSRLKYRPLPGITPPPETPKPVEETITIDASRGSRPVSAKSGITIGSDPASADMLPMPVPSQVFLSIRARSYAVEEFRNLFDGYHSFFQERRIDYTDDSSTQSLEIEHDGTKNIHAAMLSLLNDVFQDPDIQAVPEQALKSTPPYFAQICPKQGRGILLDSDACEEDTGSNARLIGDVMYDEPRHTDLDIIGSVGFQNCVETVLEGTIYNLLQEANVGEFDWHRYPILFQVPKTRREH